MRRIKPIPGSPPLFGPSSDWVAPRLSELPDWGRAKLCGIDSEFQDDTIRTLGIGARRGAKLVGYSFCLDQDPGGPRYIPLRHPGEGNVDCEQGLNYLRDNLAKFEGNLIGANMNVDLDIFFYENIKPNYNKVLCKDIQVRDPLLWEHHFKYSLEAVAERWGFPGKDEAKLKEAAVSYGYDIKSAGWKACIAKLPAKFVGPYGEADAGILLPIYHAQQKAIDEQGLNEVDELEARLLPILLKMRQRGIPIDFDHLDKVEKWALEEETKCVNEIKRLTGWDIGIGHCMAAARVAPALQAIGIDIPRTDSGNAWSIKSPWLATLNHPVAALIHQTRQMNKLRCTFASSVRRYETGGRVHSTFRQIVGASEKNEQSGAAYGRLSSAHLNIQQQPSRAKFANFWRAIYVPETGCQWLSCDYSGVEPRWYCSISEILKLPGAKEFGDMYRTNPRLDRHQAVADLTGLSRKDAKTVGLGLDYRMGSLKLALSLKLPTRWLVETGDGRDRRKHYFSTRKQALEFRSSYVGERVRISEVAGEEAQALLDKFHSGAPFIRELARKAEEKAKATGVVKILGGRHLHFPMDKHGVFQHTYKACSKIVQGTAAYQMKMALIALDRYCPELDLYAQIHDEVWGSIESPSVAKKVSSIMTEVCKARVPFRCDAEIGPNCGSLTLMCAENDCLNFVDPVDKFYCPKHIAH